MSESVVSHLDTLIQRLRPASRWALETTLAAVDVDGVGGTLVLEIPRNPKHDPEVSFLAGRYQFSRDDRRH
jgi:hypothetical protein